MHGNNFIIIIMLIKFIEPMLSDRPSVCSNFKGRIINFIVIVGYRLGVILLGFQLSIKKSKINGINKIKKHK